MTEPGAEARGPAQRGIERREAIIEAALEVFAARGYRSGALGEIAARVDVTPAGILYHFGSKEGLLVAVIRDWDRRAGEALSTLDLTGRLEDLDLLIPLARAIESERGLAALHTVLMAESFDPEGPAHGYFVARSRVVRFFFENLLSEAQRAGEVRPEIDCAAKAGELVAYMEGAAMLWLLDDTLSLVDLYSSYIETFVATVKA
ncbi:MAG TPA: TetR/AcrR family transcriptional regulator [Acidimicrobiales bacterium]|nr:TetR/AcrR family transcriptional regulator [Acidimicrobiales bacterium]